MRLYSRFLTAPTHGRIAMLIDLDFRLLNQSWSNLLSLSNLLSETRESYTALDVREQSRSSELSVDCPPYWQSICPSHTRLFGMHRPLSHWTQSGKHPHCFSNLWIVIAISIIYVTLLTWHIAVHHLMMWSEIGFGRRPLSDQNRFWLYLAFENVRTTGRDFWDVSGYKVCEVERAYSWC